MQVFKNYFKVLKSSRTIIIIYMGVFMMISLLFGLSKREDTSSNFEQSKTNITIINHDQNTELIKSLKSHLSKTCNFINIEDNEEKLMDAIFFHEIYYVLIIPEDFSKNFRNGDEVKLQKISLENNEAVNYIELSINNFISTAKVFYESGNAKNLSETKILELTLDSLDTNVNVNLSTKQANLTENNLLVTYLNYFVYVFMAVFILAISIVMSTYNELDTKRRNLVAPITLKKINIQLFLGNMVFTTITTILLLIIGFVISGKTLFDKHSLLLIANAFTFSLSALSIGFFIAQFPLKREAISAISNIISLGLSFICGAFVPLELISDNIIKIAKFTPAYWFIAGNNLIGKSSEITSEVIRLVIKHIGIQFIFTIALFMLALVVTKANRTKEA